MRMIKLAVTLIALLVGGWFTFDGARAWLKGDYLTAHSGPRAGQLGPWSKVITAIGLDPRGTTMKCVHITLGALWLISAILFLTRPALGWFALTACSVMSLWYLPIGTVLSVVELFILCLPITRSLR